MMNRITLQGFFLIQFSLLSVSLKKLEHILPDNVRKRIQNAWADLQPDDFHDNWNPIIRVPLLVSRVENQLVIDELHVAQPDGPPQPQAVGGQPMPHAQALNGHAAQLQACLNQIHHCQTEIQEIKSFHCTELALLQSWMQIKFTTQVRNINRLQQLAPFAPTQPANTNNNNQQPALQEQGFGGGVGIPAGKAAAALVNEHGPARPNAVLCKGSKSIHDLWREQYQHGIACLATTCPQRISMARRVVEPSLHTVQQEEPCLDGHCEPCHSWI
jgi:hypothetical protein